MKLILCFLILFSFSFTQGNQNIDGIAAIVEEHLVLKSDLAQMVNMSIIQNKMHPSKDIEKIKALEKTILESMIDQKIILKKAELDSVIVEENEVNLALDQQIQMLISQAGGEKRLKKPLVKALKVFEESFGMK